MRYVCKTQTGNKVLFEIVAESLYPALQAAEIQLYKMFGDCDVRYVTEYADYDTARDMTILFNDDTMMKLMVEQKEE